jgi:uncharacterized membrane protein
VSSWLVLLVLAIGSAGIRYFMNVRFTAPLWLFPAGSLFIITAGLVWVHNADPKGDLFKNNDKVGRKVEFAEAADIIHKRCTPCHSQTPTNEMYKVAPNGVTYDTPEQICRWRPRSRSAQALKNMPLAA